ncbi:MAG: tRNA epoxyqueuosine(34) reductase QueG [Bacteroidales bacterium]
MPQNRENNIAKKIKTKALELGFDACGITPAREVDRDMVSRFNNWIAQGSHGSMLYMENYRDKRLNPSLILPDGKSVICLALNYHQRNFQPEDACYKVSQYAAGTDYHTVVKSKLYRLLEFIKSEHLEANARVFTDSAPLLERYLAWQAGLGAPGKNACLILPRKGSYFFLAEIVTDLELDYDTPMEKDFCGKCTRCIDACPTNAIVAPGVINAKSCISYLTIELKDDIPQEFSGKTRSYIFGCDICQEVCPHNVKFAVPTKEKEFTPLPAIADWNKKNWEDMDNSSYRKNFIKTNSPVGRASFIKLKSNIEFVKKGSKK